MMVRFVINPGLSQTDYGIVSRERHTRAGYRVYLARSREFRDGVTGDNSDMHRAIQQCLSHFGRPSLGLVPPPHHVGSGQYRNAVASGRPVLIRRSMATLTRRYRVTVLTRSIQVHREEIKLGE